MDLSKYKAHESWPVLKNLYMTDSHITDWEESRNKNWKKDWRMVFQVEGQKWNDWVFKNLLWYYNVVFQEFLGASYEGNTPIPDDLGIVNTQLRSAPSILARLSEMTCEVDGIYQHLGSLIWRACPENYTIEDKRAEKRYFLTFIRTVREKMAKAEKNVMEKIQVLKRSQDELLAEWKASNSAYRASQK